MLTEVTTLCLRPEASLEEAMALMDRTRRGIVLIVDEEHRLIGTVTDGDLRRAILAHRDLAQPVSTVLVEKAGTRYARPLTAPMGTDHSTYVRILKEHNILHLPLVDEQNRVAGLVTLDEFLVDQAVHAVVMAGGRGTRLYPLTEDTPKPMLPIGDRPLLEIIVGQLRTAGIKHVKVSTHHQAGRIEQHFRDGREFGVELSYLEEDRPLGTAGCLGLMEPWEEPLLVINGDVLTQLDFRAMLAYHREHRADLTIAVRKHEFQIPFGVVEADGHAVRRLTEKPSLELFVNAGIYLLEPIVHRYVRRNQRLDMTDLIQRLLGDRRPVLSFPVREYWCDIGDPADYERAQQEARESGWRP